MKKHVTLLSILALTGGIAFGQIAVDVNQMVLQKKQFPQKLKTDGSPSQVKTPINVNDGVEKASGDTAWVDHFNTPSDWISGGTSPDYTLNGWSIGTTTNSWNSSVGGTTGNMGTSGNFARFANGDTPPSPTVPVGDQLNGPFTLEYNGIIDLTGKIAPFVEFEQYGARFITVQEVQISIDGGTTWLTAASNADIAPLTGDGGAVFPKPQTRRFFIGDLIAGNASNVQIRLFWAGMQNGPSMNYVDYGWFVDNIRIMEGYANDVKMIYPSSFMGNLGAQYSQIPVSQLSATAKIGFSAITKNIGDASQDVTLNAVSTPAGFTGAGTVVTIASALKDTVLIDPSTQGYLIPSTVGTYSFALSLSSNNTLSSTADDNGTSSIQVTDYVMASDSYDGTPASITGAFTGWANPSGDPGIGTYFEFFQPASFQHVKVGIYPVAAADQSDYMNPLNVALYKWDGTSDPMVFDPLVVSQEITITAADFGKLVDLPFTNPVNVVAGDVFKVVAGFTDGADVPIALSGYVPAGQTIGVDGGNNIQLASADSLQVEAPVVRIDFKDYTGIEENNTTPNFAVYSVENGLNVDLSSTELKGATIQVVSMDGKVIAKQALTTNQMNTIKVNVPTGIYFYAISNDSSSYQGKVFIK